MATATALTDGSLVRLEKEAMNSSEKRLARMLLLPAHVRKQNEAEIVVLGLIEYNGKLRVHSSLLNIVLHD